MIKASSPCARSNSNRMNSTSNGNCFYHFCITTAGRVPVKGRGVNMRLSCLCGQEISCRLGKLTKNLACTPSFTPSLAMVTRCSTGSFTFNTACLLFGRLRTRMRLREVGCFANKLACGVCLGWTDKSRRVEGWGD